jgi:glycosyl transferase family 87
MAPQQLHWLKAEHLKIAAAILIVAYPVTIVGWGLMSPDLVTMAGIPFGSDFITFWAASHLALLGEPAAAFDMARIVAAEKTAVPANDGVFLWHYPPSFQLFILPLSLLPYLAAYFLWVLTTLALLAVVVRRFAPSPYTLPLLATFTGTFFNFFHGQNGFLTAALFGGGMLLLRSRPIAAGLLLGLMSYKPQFGLLIPIALIAGRHWRAFAAAAVSTLALAAASWAVLGAEVWLAFWKNLPFVQEILAQGRLPWPKIPSVFVSLRTLGLPINAAYAGQGMAAVFVAVTIAYIWRQHGATRIAIAALIAGAPLMSPYVFDYDLALLALPIAILAWDGVERGWHPGEREILVLAFFTPALVSSIAYTITLQVGPLFLLALFATAVRRALRAPAALGAALPARS